MATPAGENTNKGAQDKQGNKEFSKETPAIGKKLTNLKKKEGTVTLITPPSWFQNQDVSFCLINLSKRDKDSFADQLNKHMAKKNVNLYIWDDNNFSGLDPFGNESDAEYEKYLENWKPNQKGRDYSWLLNACRASTYIIMNMDYSSRPLMVWSGYILTLSKTFFINSNFFLEKSWRGVRAKGHAEQVLSVVSSYNRNQLK